MARVETVGQAAKFCVPTALAFLTGFTREAVVIGLARKIGARNYNGGYMRSDYMHWLKTIPKQIVELGEMRKGPFNATQLPSGTTWLVSGAVHGNRSVGHCFIVWNGLLFDNRVVGRPVTDDYICWFNYPVIHSQMNTVIKKMHDQVTKKAA